MAFAVFVAVTVIALLFMLRFLAAIAGKGHENGASPFFTTSSKETTNDWIYPAVPISVLQVRQAALHGQESRGCGKLLRMEKPTATRPFHSFHHSA